MNFKIAKILICILMKLYLILYQFILNCLKTYQHEIITFDIVAMRRCIYVEETSFYKRLNAET